MTPITRKFVAYYRVSTPRQGESGLGLEAQRDSVTRFVEGAGVLQSEFCEVESGKRCDRPELLKAIADCRRRKATLVIAKLDRLARNVAFVSALMEAGVDFVACDNPHANRLTIHILAAVAEDEARRISERTKAALLAFKARGGLLGAQDPRCPRLTKENARRGQAIAARISRERAELAYADLVPLMAGMREVGKSYREITAELNRLGHSTRNGKFWNPGQVQRVLGRYSSLVSR